MHKLYNVTIKGKVNVGKSTFGDFTEQFVGWVEEDNEYLIEYNIRKLDAPRHDEENIGKIPKKSYIAKDSFESLTYKQEEIC